MHRFFVTLFSLVLMAGTSLASTTYNDATGDLNDGTSGGDDLSGFTHLDIASVEVSNNATDLSFAVTLVGDIIATDWGKYMIGINTNSATGDTAGNGWARPISMSPDGMDYWIGSWVDFGDGAELYTWDAGGAAWNLTEATYNAPPDDEISISKTQFSATVTVPLSDLSLGVGDMFWFDVYSSGGGGGDSAVDALSSSVPSITTWGGPFNSPGDSGLRKYTVVPEPSSIITLGLVALAAGLGYVRRWR